ncbi:E3 ubiquitin-protein ligase TRIM71-like [Haliotis rufescens]|uniref:E3 ubiquitin-protein ligase TRIM71-like n=1 Tax=Haliotis rufescens TaxID=6454 RepID=UPI00201F06D3|nr:E3 ubiquitin-protein ligase TRIM71-like [Haliotis rufescens]
MADTSSETAQNITSGVDAQDDIGLAGQDGGQSDAHTPRSQRNSQDGDRPGADDGGDSDVNVDHVHEVEEDGNQRAEGEGGHPGEEGVVRARYCGLCEEGHPAEGRCMNCCEDLCTNCIKYHERLRVTALHNILLFEPGATSDIVVPTRSNTDCHKHNEPLKFYCQTCKQAVCRDCILTAHKGHQAVDLTDEVDNAKKEAERLLKRVQNSVRRSEREMGDLRTYHAEFLDKVRKVSDVIDKLHTAVLQRVERSYQELTQMIAATKEDEVMRLEQIEEFLQQRLLSASDFTAVADHVLTSQDGIDVMLKLDMMKQSVTPVCQHADFQKGHAEFFLAKNPRFTCNTADNILGRVAFSLMWPPVTNTPERRAFIREIRLKREVAFHIWEMHCTKPSVRGIVEGPNGVVWVATPRSLLTIGVNGERKNSVHLTTDIASITGGPDGRLLVAFIQGNTNKILYQDNWSNFAPVPGPMPSIASSIDGQRILVPQMCHGAPRLLVICNQGKDIVDVDLPPQLASDFDIPSFSVGPDGEVAMCIGKRDMVVILTPSFKYKSDYHGPDGVLYPRSICYDKLGHLIVADSKRCNVQLVSKDGRFLSYLLNKEDFQDIGSPTAVTVDNRGRLWIGTGNGNVCAYTYMHDIL